MSLYLQRLLDRAAGAALEGAPARPLLAGSSPVVGFDQRLANPELASDFTLLGASPQAEAVGADEAVQAPPLPTGRRSAPAAPAAPASSAGAVPAPVPIETGGLRPDTLVPVREAPPESSAALPPPPVAPTAQERALQALAIPVPPPPPAAVAALQTAASHIAPGTGDVAREEQPREESLSSPRNRLAASEAPRRTAAASPQRIAGDTHHQSAAAAAPLPAAPAEAVPSSAPHLAAPAGAPPSIAEPAARAPAEPVLDEPQPLPVAPAALQADDVARIVRRILSAERAAKTAAAVPRQPGAGERAADGGDVQKVLRPTTAAEASVIGKLESSRYRPMLFGVRRR
jgi:hypothetical protein